MSQDQSPAPKKRGCQRGCLTAVVVFLILAVVLVWFNIPTPLRISEETTYILGPMMPDGKRIDYFRAMEEKFYPPEMDTEDNGYRLLVQKFGENAWRHDPTTTVAFASMSRLYIYEKLGLDPNEAPTTPLKIESPIAFLYRTSIDKTSKDQADAFQQVQVSGWTFDDYPMLKDWLEENTAGIDVLAEAVRKPMFCCVHFVRARENASMFMPTFSGMLSQGWMQAVHARATYRMGIGDIDRAIDDLVTLYRLGRHTGRQVTLLSWVIGRYAEMMGSSIGIGSNPNVAPTKEQIERLLTELTALPPRPTFGEVVETERFMNLAALQEMYYNSYADDQCCGGTFLTKNIRWLVDMNVFMERANKYLNEQINETFEIDQWIQSQQSSNPLPYLFIRSRTIKIHDTIMPPVLIMGTRENARSKECCVNLHLLTLALLLYEKEHGSLPDGDWRAAIRPYLGENADKYFRCPGSAAADNETTYVMIGGASNQVLLVETHEPQTNEPLTLESVMNVLGSNHSGSVNVGLRNGAVRSLDKDTAPDELRKLFDGSDGL